VISDSASRLTQRCHEDQEIDFEGCQAVELTTSRLRLVVTTDRGPRIGVSWGAGRRNLFYWHLDEAGRDGWRLLGGIASGQRGPWRMSPKMPTPPTTSRVTWMRRAGPYRHGGGAPVPEDPARCHDPRARCGRI